MLRLNQHTSQRGTSRADDDALLGCESWLPLVDSKREAAPASSRDGGRDRFTLEGPTGQRVRLVGRAAKGAAVVESLRAILDEVHVRQVILPRSSPNKKVKSIVTGNTQTKDVGNHWARACIAPYHTAPAPLASIAKGRCGSQLPRRRCR